MNKFCAGARAIKNSPVRARAFARAAEKAGLKVETQLWTIGTYDRILILQAEDEAQALAAIARLSAGGFVRTETFPAFDAGEFAAIVRG